MKKTLHGGNDMRLRRSYDRRLLIIFIALILALVWVAKADAGTVTTFSWTAPTQSTDGTALKLKMSGLRRAIP